VNADPRAAEARSGGCIEGVSPVYCQLYNKIDNKNVLFPTSGRDCGSVPGTIHPDHRFGLEVEGRNAVMRIFTAAIGVASCLAVMSGGSLVATPAAADTPTYIACNQYDECWRVHHRYVYPSDQVITIHDSDWYDAHRQDVRLLGDPADDHGWYDRDANWRADPGARAVVGGAKGAGLGAAIGCVATILIGCAPGAALGAAVGGGAGAAVGAASTPSR
jgi:hypothetical protein